MKRAVVAVTVALLAAGSAGLAWAVPPGFALVFDGQGEGKVVFAGAKHTGKGMHCSNCHLDVFDVARSSQITRADHKRKVACFVCHDGATAFAAKQNCDHCHAALEEPAVATSEVPTQ